MIKENPEKIIINTIGPWLDKGESAILVSMIANFKDFFPNIKITASASTIVIEDIDIIKYSSYDIKLVPGLFSRFHEIIPRLNILKYKFLKIIVAGSYLVLLILLNTFWLVFYKYLNLNLNIPLLNKEVINEYTNSDWVISCGGQNLIHIQNFPIIPIYEIFFAKFLDKPLMLYSQSIGPFDNNYLKPIIRYFLNKVDLITTREKKSKDILSDLNIKSPIFVTADAAFLVKSISKKEALHEIETQIKNSNKTRLIGMTTIEWDFPREKYNSQKTILFENYVETMSNIANYLIEKYDAHIVFFPQNISITSNDLKISKEVQKLIKNKSNTTILTSDYSPEQIKGMYGCMELLIGTRFHSCILALSEGVPCIAIEYMGLKASGIMELLDLEEFAEKIENLDLNNIIPKLDYILENRDSISSKIKNKIVVMEKENKKNIELAKQYMRIKE